MLIDALRWKGKSVSAPVIHSWFPETTPELSMVSTPPESDTAGDGGVDPWEVALVRETQQGRPDAFNPLVTRYAPRIRAYLNRMVRNQEEAEDLTQETFIKAFRALHRFNPEKPFRSWLYTIATNTGLNAIRGKKRRGTQVDMDWERVSSPESARKKGASSDSIDREEALNAALAQLSPRASRLVALHYQEGLSLAEAGAVLDLTENAAKVALCRARKQLRELMVSKR